MATTKRHDVKDLSLAPEGARRIAWADRHMPVLAAIRELSYRPNASARTLVTRRSHVVGVVLSPGLRHPFFQEVLYGLRDRLGAAGRRRMEERFSLDAMVEAKERLYEELVSARRASAA